MIQRRLFLDFLYLVVCIVFVLYCYPAYGAEKKEGDEAFSPGKTLPQFKVDAPASEKEQQYLGLKKHESFSLSQISSRLIVLEIFGVLCLHCRKQAPILNKIYKLIQEDPDLNKDIKMIGIAPKNKREQIATWKSYFRVPFPLLPDPEGDIWQKIGKPGTPLTLVLTHSGKVLSAHSGPTEDIEEFFREIKRFHKQL